MTKKQIFTYTTLLIYTYAMYYLSWIYWALNFILSLCLYTLLFYFLHFIWVKFRNKQVKYFPDFINYFLQRISVFLIFITILFAWWTYLLNEVFPAPMPEFTISNWTKTVKFQAMSHIWTKKFYDTVINNLIQHKKSWWVYFYEWVKPGTDENLKKFNQAIWINFDDDLYANFSKLYWVVNQNNKNFIWLVNNLDFNIDLNMNQIVTLYEEKINSKEDPTDIYKNKLPIDANKIIIKTLAWLNDRQLKILVYINQAILNFIVWSDSTQNFLTDNFANKDLFDVILGERNQVLSDAIINSEYNNIYITYWLLHFDWVFKILQEEDPKWQIISVNNLYPIK